MVPWGRRKTDHFVFKTTAPAGNIADGRRFIGVRVANLHQNKECSKLPAEKERPQVPT